MNLEDGSASNIYVGHLKMAYKEAFAALDKIAILINHYLGLGLPEQRCYYGTVWYEHDSKGKPSDPPVLEPQVKSAGYRLFGLYLLCKNLCGSKYSDSATPSRTATCGSTQPTRGRREPTCSAA